MNERVTCPGDTFTDSNVKEKILVHKRVGIHLLTRVTFYSHLLPPHVSPIGAADRGDASEAESVWTSASDGG